MVSKGYHMEALLLKNLPKGLKQRLKREAERHRRSMTQQAVVILEQGLPPGLPWPLPKPIEPLKPVTAAMIRSGIRQGRK
jgi:plasmid stability protein